MKKLICECCGSNEITKISNEYYQCEICGVKYKNDDISSLLVDTVDETVNTSVPKIQSMINNAYRSVGDANWVRAYNISEEILNIDSQNPDALLIAGIAMGKANPENVDRTMDYSLEAIQSKKERATDESDFNSFLNNALKTAYDVYETGMQVIVNGTYSDSVNRLHQDFADFNDRMNEEKFRQAVSRGEKYNGNSAAYGGGITPIEAIGTVAIARREARSILNNFNSLVKPEIIKLVDYVLSLDKLDLNESGIEGLSGLLIVKYDNNISINYDEKDKKREEFEKIKQLAASFNKLTNNQKTKEKLKTLIVNLDKAISYSYKLKNKDPEKQRKRQVITQIIVSSIPVYGVIGVLINLISYCLPSLNIYNYSRLDYSPEEMKNLNKDWLKVSCYGFLISHIIYVVLFAIVSEFC